MCVAEKFMSDLVKGCGKNPVFTDGGTWYPIACQFLKLDHHIHSSFGEMLDRKKDAVNKG